MTRKFLSALLMIFAITAVHGAVIKGTIRTESEQIPVKEVRITVNKTLKSAFTNKNGKFSINGLKPGNYKVQIRKKGFVPLVREVEVREDNAVELSLIMAKDLLLNYEMIVSATKTNHTLGDVPVSSAIVISEELKDKSVTNFQDLFAFMGGINIERQKRSWGSRGSVSIQGLDSKHTLILVNGQRYTGGHGGADISTIPVGIIEKVEIVKGPASVLYGSDALAGVVNIITKSPFSTKPSLSLKTGRGSDNNQLYEIGGNYSKDKFGASLHLLKKHADGYKKGMDNIDEYSMASDLTYKFNHNTSLTLTPKYEWSDLELEDRRQDKISINSSLKWNNNLGSAFEFRASFFKYHYNSHSSGTNWKDFLWEGELTGSHMLSEHHMLTGGYRFNAQKRDDTGKEFKADETMHSVYLQDEITLNDFTVILGSRLDHHDRWGSVFNPKINLMYKFSAALRLKTSWGKAFKSPDLTRLYAPPWIMGQSTLVLSNPDLKPEKSKGFQFGFEWKPSSKLKTEISFFRNDISNLITYVTNRKVYPRTMTYRNIEEAMTQGIEFSMKASVLRNLSLYTAYTYMDTEDKETDMRLLERPTHALVVGVKKKFENIGLNINLDAKYVGKRLVSQKISMRETIYYDLDPYVTANLTVSKDIFDTCRIYVRIDNLLNKKDIADEFTFDGIKFFSGIEFIIK